MTAVDGYCDEMLPLMFLEKPSNFAHILQITAVNIKNIGYIYFIFFLAVSTIPQAFIGTGVVLEWISFETP